MGKTIVDVSNNQQIPLHCSINTGTDIVERLKNFSPPPGWARAHPEIALKILFICPQLGPWVDEILN